MVDGGGGRGRDAVVAGRPLVTPPVARPHHHISHHSHPTQVIEVKSETVQKFPQLPVSGSEEAESRVVASQSREEAGVEAVDQGQRIDGRRNVEAVGGLLVLQQDQVEVEVVELGRVLALDVVPPVADAVLLVEDGALGTEEGRLSLPGFTNVEYLRST